MHGSCITFSSGHRVTCDMRPGCLMALAHFLSACVYWRSISRSQWPVSPCHSMAVWPVCHGSGTSHNRTACHAMVVWPVCPRLVMSCRGSVASVQAASILDTIAQSAPIESVCSSAMVAGCIGHRVDTKHGAAFLARALAHT